MKGTSYDLAKIRSLYNMLLEGKYEEKINDVNNKLTEEYRKRYQQSIFDLLTYGERIMKFYLGDTCLNNIKPYKEAISFTDIPEYPNVIFTEIGETVEVYCLIVGGKYITSSAGSADKILNLDFDTLKDFGICAEMILIKFQNDLNNKINDSDRHLRNTETIISELES